MKVRLREAACVGHGRCYALAPDLFGEDERGHCLVKREGVPAELADQARLGEQNCPEGAIALED